MKIVCTVLCVILFVVLILPLCAFAQSNVAWVRIVDDGVNLYAQSNSSKVIFQLQKSYYLQVVDEQDSMFLVSVMQNETLFPQIMGYVWKSEVEICDEQPKLPYYPTETITVNSDSAQMKLSPVPSANNVVTVTNTQTMSYYGSVVSYGETWYYVYYCGKFGYVLSSSVTKPVIALHPTPIVQEVFQPTTPETPDEPTEQEPTEVEPQSSLTEIILIVFVALLALGISLALFLPGNVKKRDVFDSEI